MRAMLAAPMLIAAVPALADLQEYNIFAVPSAEIDALVAETADDLDAYGLATFHARGYVTHATLYLTAFPEDALEEMREIAAGIAAETDPFPMRVEGYDLTPGHWLFLHIEQSAALRALSDRVVEATAHLRDPAYEAPGWVQGNDSKLAMFAAWGCPNVFDEFGPHLTQLAAEESPALQDFVAAQDDDARPVAEGRVIGIGFAPVDPLGQARASTETIWRFDTRE